MTVYHWTGCPLYYNSGECRPTSTYWDTAPGCHGNVTEPDTCASKRHTSGTTGHLRQQAARGRDHRPRVRTVIHFSGPVLLAAFQPRLWNLHQWSTFLCLRVETRQCLGVHLPVLLQCNHSPVWRCPLLAWICNGETRRHRMILFRRDWHKCGQMISTSGSLYPWVSKFLLLHRYRFHNHLFSSQQHLLLLRVSKPRMLSWWLRPCGKWCRSWFNSNNALVLFREGQELPEWDIHRQQLLQCYRLGYPGLIIVRGFLPHLRWPMFLSTHHWHLLSWDLLHRLEHKDMFICNIRMFSLHSALQIVIHLVLTIVRPSSPWIHRDYSDCLTTSTRLRRLQVSRTMNKFWRETMKFFMRWCAVLWHRSFPTMITLMIRIRRLDPWFPQMMCTRTKSPGSYSLFWKLHSGTFPRLLKEWITQMTSQRPHFVIHLHHRTPRRRLDCLAVPDSEDTLVGAHLAGFADQWQNLLGECRSVQILQSGVLSQWLDQHPPLTRTPISFHTRNRKQDLQKAVDSLLQKGAIEHVLNSCSLVFYSRLFLVPKKTGDLCPVIDLSTLNKSLVVPHFQMETAQTVRAAIHRQEWTVSIDMREAYLHVPMNLSIRKYLRFHVNNRTYQFTCLPFGLATSPREFSKILRPVVQLLRMQGVHLHVYLDDWLIWADLPEMANSHAQLVMTVLCQIWWIINLEKSELTPKQEFNFIGMRFRTHDLTVAPLPKMRVKVQSSP